MYEIVSRIGHFICWPHEASVPVFYLIENSLRHTKSSFFPQEASVDLLQEHLDRRV